MVQLYHEEGLKGVVRGVGRYIYHNILPRWIIEPGRKLKYWLKSNNEVEHQIGNISVGLPVEKYWQFKRFNSIHNERPLLEDLVTELRPEDVFVDAGAYYGWHSIIAAEVAFKGEVYAFEPHPISYQRLFEIVDSDKWNIEPFEIALSNSNSALTLTDKSASASVTQKSEINTNTIDVAGARGDDVIEEHDLNMPTVMKIDVEGAEVATLLGFSKTIYQDSCRLIYVELHPNKAPEGFDVEASVRQYLNEAGYKCTVITQGSKEIIKASKENFR